MSEKQFHRYYGNGVDIVDPVLVAEAAGIDRTIHMGRKGWLLGTTAHYTRLFAGSKRNRK